MSEITVVKNLVSTQDNERGLSIHQDVCPQMYIQFNKKETNFINNDEYTKFVKATENLIRKSKEYRGYIAYLKEKVGLRNCVVFGNVDDSKATVEMHHGPIFTLYDYVEITITHLFKNKEPVNSFRVARQVMRDHYDNLVQIVMVSEAVHKVIHAPKKGNQKYFISIDSAWGDVVKYLTQYVHSINFTHISKIKRYLDDYAKYGSTDERGKNHGQFFKEYIKSWSDIR